VRGNYDDYRYDGWYAYEGLVNRDISEGRWLGLDTRWTADLRGRQRLVASVELRRNLRGYQRNFDEDPAQVYLDSDQTSNELGLVVQDEVTLAKGWTLNAGVRHDRYDEFDSTNPRLALIAEPRAGTVVKGLYATAFRAPSVYELYYADDGNSQKVNPHLGPEAITSLEFVWEQQLSPRVASAVSFFHYAIDDLITLVMDPADDLLVVQNVDGASASGVELGIDARMLHGVQGRASYSYQTSEDDCTGTALSNSPQHLAKLNAQAPLFDNRASIALQLQYMAARKTRQDDEGAGHVTTDLTLLWRLRSRRLTVSASAYNLFDTAYGDPVSDELRQDLVPREGRTFNLKATVNW
jgi:outer membrane receptor for ferrienterochelin and colicins